MIGLVILIVITYAACLAKEKAYKNGYINGYRDGLIASYVKEA
jgi:hypothetical protein